MEGTKSPSCPHGEFGGKEGEGKGGGGRRNARERGGSTRGFIAYAPQWQLPCSPCLPDEPLTPSLVVSKLLGILSSSCDMRTPGQVSCSFLERLAWKGYVMCPKCLQFRQDLHSSSKACPPPRSAEPSNPRSLPMGRASPCGHLPL